MGTMEELEQRRRRGLGEVAELEAIRRARPLQRYEERWLHRSLGLVQEMDGRIEALKHAARELHWQALRPSSLPTAPRDTGARPVASTRA